MKTLASLLVVMNLLHVQAANANVGCRYRTLEAVKLGSTVARFEVCRGLSVQNALTENSQVPLGPQTQPGAENADRACSVVGRQNGYSFADVQGMRESTTKDFKQSLIPQSLWVWALVPALTYVTKGRFSKMIGVESRLAQWIWTTTATTGGVAAVNGAWVSYEALDRLNALERELSLNIARSAIAPNGRIALATGCADLELERLKRFLQQYEVGPVEVSPAIPLDKLNPVAPIQDQSNVPPAAPVVPTQGQK